MLCRINDFILNRHFLLYMFAVFHFLNLPNFFCHVFTPD